MKPVSLINLQGIFGNYQPIKEIYEEHPRTIAINFIHSHIVKTDTAFAENLSTPILY